MTMSVGMRSLAVKFPSEIRKNSFWKEKYPELVKSAEERTLAKLWQVEQMEPTTAFDIEMKPYLKDPFRGAVERRAFVEGESGITLERDAGREAVALAGLELDDIDLLISTHLFPVHYGNGNAVWLAHELGLEGAAWNLETACNGVVSSFEVACGLVRAGMYKNVLITVSCTYTRDIEESDTLQWFLGSGGGAVVVGEVEQGQGYLGSKIVHTGPTRHAFVYKPKLHDNGEIALYMRAGKKAGSVLRDTSEEYLKTCCHGALEDAGVRLEDIDCFVTNTPTAWFSAFATRALGLDPEMTVNTNPFYGNIGPALTTANLHCAARTGKLKPGDLLLVYAVGSLSSAGAVVMRWGEVPMGKDPVGVYDR